MRIKRSFAALAASALLPGAALAAPVLSGVTGQVFDATGTTLGTVDQVVGLIDGVTPDARFTVGALDYPNDADTAPSTDTLLSAFLGDDAASLVGDDFTLAQSVFVFTGQILLSEGVQSFTVASDDGFRLLIDGALISEFNASRGFTATTASVDAGLGLASFTLIYYDDLGDGGIRFLVDGEVAEALGAAAVPLPAAAALMLVGLAGGAFVRRRA